MRAVVKAIIFDFDGVLVESNDIKTAAFAELFNNYPDYRDAMMDHHLHHQSAPRMTKFRYFVSQLLNLAGPAAEAKAEQLADAFSLLVVDRIVACPEVSGASALLADLKGRLPLYIASHTPEDELKTILARRGWRRYFNHVFGNPPTTKTEAVRRILELEKCAPGQVLFIGDAPSDHAAAQTSGLMFIGRDSGLLAQREDVRIEPDMLSVGRAIKELL
jgi:phosphoglycolate phosphatase-like HAD superfamily hydrolase